jgi:hypothetical protein
MKLKDVQLVYRFAGARQYTKNALCHRDNKEPSFLTAWKEYKGTDRIDHLFNLKCSLLTNNEKQLLIDLKVFDP